MKRIHTRRVAIVGGVALLIVLAVLWQYHEQIRFRWYLFRNRETLNQAREQILSWRKSYRPAEFLTGALGELKSDGDAGFRAIVTLLEDDEPRVWVRTAELIDAHYIMANARDSGYRPKPANRVVSYVRMQSQRSVLRLLLFDYYQHNTEWRSYWSYYEPDDVVAEQDCWGYWGGKKNQGPLPKSDGIAFCEDVLFDRYSYDGIYHEPSDLKRRAIDALVSMWRPQSDDELNRGVLEALKRFTRARKDLDLCLHALNRLAARSGVASKTVSPRLWNWELTLGICPPELDARLREFWDEDPELTDDGFLTALFHLDHPRVRRIATKIHEELGEHRIQKALTVAKKIPLPFRGWFPQPRANDRHFQESKASRMVAILNLVDSDGLAAEEKLLEALSKETDDDVLRVLKSCLFSLGRSEQEAEAKKILSESLEGSSVEQDGTLISECIGQILRSGERSVLDAVMETAIHKKRPELLFSLNAAIEEFPLSELLLDLSLGVSRVGPEKESNVELLRWWNIHRMSLSWDVERRRYLLRP